MNTNPLTKIPAIKIPGLFFQVCEVTPVIAADWLKRNRKNRKLKDATLDSYARDMRNGAWFLTHQGIAFDDAGCLIDGQHRRANYALGRTARGNLRQRFTKPFTVTKP